MEVGLEYGGDTNTYDHANDRVVQGAHQEQTGTEFSAEERPGHGIVPVTLETIAQNEAVTDDWKFSTGHFYTLPPGLPILLLR
jgi:hypothetical protein